jgi:ribosomal protein L32
MLGRIAANKAAAVHTATAAASRTTAASTTQPFFFTTPQTVTPSSAPFSMPMLSSSSASSSAASSSVASLSQRAWTPAAVPLPFSLLSTVVHKDAPSSRAPLCITDVVVDDDDATSTPVPLECAVPKKRRSIRRRRLIRINREKIDARWDYTTYRTCDGCGEPVRAHFLCLTCMKMKPKRME